MFSRFRIFRAINAFKSFQNKALRSNAARPNLLSKNNNRAEPVSAPEQETSFQKMVKENTDKAIQSTKDFTKLLVQATKDAYGDAKYLRSISSTKSKDAYTLNEIIESQRIKKDLTKFTPYYACMLLPGGFAALLFMRALFPRSTPSYFMTPEAMNKEYSKYVDKQANAHGALMDYLMTAMEKEGYQGSDRNTEHMQKFFEEHQDTLLKALDPHKMNSDMLKSASDFLMFEYVDGTHIVSTVYRSIVNTPRYIYNLSMWIARNSYRAVWTHPFFNYQFKLNSFVFEGFKENLILRQFEKQIKLLQAENRAMISDKFGEVKEEDYLKLSQERGYSAQNEEDAKKWIQRQWIPMVKKHADNEMFTFWWSVIHYNHH